MATRRAIPITHYDTARVPDDRPGAGPDANADFDEVRNRLINVMSRHGWVGPDFSKKRGRGGPDWVYFVVESIYNWERYHYVELIHPEGVTRAWLRDVMRFLRTAPHWGICICSLSDGYSILFSDRIMVTGRDFEGCSDIDQFVAQLRDAVTIERMIDGCKTDASLRRLAAIPGIGARRMFLWHLHRVTDAGLAIVGRMKGAVIVHAADSKVTDKGLAHLRELTNLDSLYLENCAISDTGVAFLRGLPKLKTLDLTGTRVTDSGLRALAVLPSLRELNVTKTAVTTRGVKRLKRAVPECEVRRD